MRCIQRFTEKLHRETIFVIVKGFQIRIKTEKMIFNEQISTQTLQWA